jgi:xanthine dehydrogenase YagT iron-sulfur-binding subunit
MKEDDKPPVETPTEESTGVTRRSFLTRLGATTLLATTVPLLEGVAQVETSPAPPATAPSAAAVPVTFSVNGQRHQLKLDPRTTVLDTLREHLHLFGTKKGCDHGQCGACTVHINGRRVNSCLTFAVMHQGDEITTIEGLSHGEELHPVQAAFLEHDAFQCGYCTSGQMMSAAALLKEPCGQDDDSVRECMAGNICRCGAYPNIVAAVQTARKRA